MAHHSSNAAPEVVIAPGVLEPHLPAEPPLFTRLTVDAEAVGALMKSWGVPDENTEEIAATRIVAEGDSPVKEWRPDNIPAVVRLPIFTANAPYTVHLHLGHAHQAQTQPDEYDEGFRAAARDVSSRLVEGLSHRVDDIVLGHAALAQERQRAERLIMIRKALPRALGVIATGGISFAVAYFNHKTGFQSPELVIDALALLAPSVALYVSWTGASMAAAKERHERTLFNAWPADRRAQLRAAEYGKARAAGEQPELVTYDVSQTSP